MLFASKFQSIRALKPWMECVFSSSIVQQFLVPRLEGYFMHVAKDAWVNMASNSIMEGFSQA
jgi:hypothetical protein